jgi:lysozyme
MAPSNKFYKMLQEFEGLKLKAYQDSAGIWTIGIGTIRYPDGSKVAMGDHCTELQANEFARYDGGKMAAKLNKLLEGVNVTQNQYDALLSLMYNIGDMALSKSTLLKRVKDGGDIRSAFLMWNKAKVNGELVPVKGLTNRRNKEADLYLS